MIRVLLSLYPARWRLRYGEEFQAVLESRPLGPFDVADILLGALDARLTPHGLPDADVSLGGQSMMLRIGGYAALVGGVLWLLSAIGSGDGNDGTFLALMLIGTVALTVALAGLSAFQGRTDTALAWAAFLVPAIGMVIAAIGMAGILLGPEDGALVGSWDAWSILITGVVSTLIGSTLFAAATYRARVLSTRAAVALAVSSLAFLAVVLVSAATDGGGPALLVQIAIAAFGASWTWLGATALRRGPIAVGAPA